MKSSQALAFWTCIAVLAFAGLAHAQDKKLAPKGIDPATVAAYKKLGAEYDGLVTPPGHCWYRWESTGSHSCHWHLGPQAADRGLPGFCFIGFPDDKLPDVAVPFSLRFESLDRRHHGISDAQIGKLTHLENLTSLFLTGPNVTDAGMKDVARIKNLASLTLQGIDIDEDGLRELAGMKKLTTLQLLNCNMSIGKLREVACIKQLSVLILSKTRVTDRSLRELAPLENLTWLGLEYEEKVTDAGLKTLGTHKNLKVLRLEGTSITE